VFIEMKQVVHCILCHSIPLDVHVLGSKTQSRKRSIFYKIKNWTSTMKKHCEAKHSNILKMYISEIVQQWCFVETNAYEKQSFKVWKVITLGSIFVFVSNTTTYKKIRWRIKSFHWQSCVGCCEKVTLFKHN
jgi:hypothetical protein